MFGVYVAMLTMLLLRTDTNIPEHDIAHMMELLLLYTIE